MVLNWTPSVIVDIIVALLIFTSAILTKITPRIKKIRSLFFFRLFVIGYGIHIILFALSNLYLNIFFDQLSLIFFVPTAIFLIIGINYLMKEVIFSYTLLFIFGGCVLLLYLAFQPGLILIQLQSGYLAINEQGLLDIVYSLLMAMIGVILFYWGLKTRINAPLMIKREASIFLFGMIIGFFSIPTYIFFPKPYNNIVANIIIAFGSFIFIFAFIREPKLLYILPFTIHRIVVKDRNGYGLFDYDWSELDIKEPIFTGFINAVQLMSEEVMHIGGVLSIDLTEGILILNESEYITVGLIASKSSKLLRDSLIGFSKDFEEKFQRELNKSIIDKKEYTATYELIEKYFSNFPSKLIKSRKQPLLLAGKYVKIPLELENKLRKIFPDEEEYEAIKTELIKSPLSFYSEFTALYKEYKDEIEKISDEKMKYLDENYESNKQ